MTWHDMMPERAQCNVISDKINIEPMLLQYRINVTSTLDQCYFDIEAMSDVRLIPFYYTLFNKYLWHLIHSLYLSLACELIIANVVYVAQHNTNTIMRPFREQNIQ